MQSSPSIPGYPLPATVDPPDRLCVMVPVPNDPAHIAAFFGALHDLTQWVSWQRDSARTGTRAAAVWRKIWAELIVNNQSCRALAAGSGGEIEDKMRLRVNPDNSCQIQAWNDCTNDWCLWLDVSTCVPGAAGQQQSDGGQPPAGGQQQYCVNIQANIPYLYPVQVNSGDLITLVSAGGAWTDGVALLFSAWYCYQGQVYEFAACTGSTHTESGDPLPSVAHMSLIVAVQTDAGGTVYLPLATSGSVTIPSGVTNQNMFLIPNDDLSHTGRWGTVNACVEISRPTGFTCTLNLATSSGGFLPYPADEGPGCNPTNSPYSPGNGWGYYNCPSIGASYIEVIKSFPARLIQHADITWTCDISSGGDAEIFLEVVGSGEVRVALGSSTGATNTLSADGSWNATGIRVRVAYGSQPRTGYLTQVVMSGLGSDPC